MENRKMVNECDWGSAELQFGQTRRGRAAGRTGSSSAIFFSYHRKLFDFNASIFDCYQRVLSVMGGRGGINRRGL